MASTSIDSFKEYLASLSNPKILTLFGAGLSAASGLPTFRGAGGMWKDHEATDLATPEAFKRDPGLVWQFYAYRRHMALHAKPNGAHWAFSKLCQKWERSGEGEILCLSQNVDGLSPRANHPPAQLRLLHGSLFDIKCFNKHCDYFDANNYKNPLCPALDATDLSPDVSDKTGAASSAALFDAMNLPNTNSSNSSDSSVTSYLNSSSEKPATTKVKRIAAALDPNTPRTATIPESDLPHCPKCKSLLRPGVVWFGEALDETMMMGIYNWIMGKEKVDLMMVVGTTAKVYPAARYIKFARQRAARVVVINMDAGDTGAAGTLTKDDWMFEGDAGTIVPQLFEGVIGTLDLDALREHETTNASTE